MATIDFIGRIGKDAVLRKFGDGETDFVCDIWVADNQKKRSDGSELTYWHKVTLWRNYAATMAEHLKAGRLVAVKGKARPNFYTSKTKQIVPFIDVSVDELRLLDAPKGEQPPVPETETPATPWDVV